MGKATMTSQTWWLATAQRSPKLWPTSNVTICLAMALSTASYICVFWIPKPQKMTKASRNCSSLRLKGLTLPVFSSILLTSWQTPTAIQEMEQVLLGAITVFIDFDTYPRRLSYMLRNICHLQTSPGILTDLS